jgi:hypothetical protein
LECGIWPRANFSKPCPVVEHTSTVDAEKVLLIEKSTNPTAAWHLVGLRAENPPGTPDATKGIIVDGTNYILQLKLRTNKNTNGVLSITPFGKTEATANYLGNGDGTNFGAWQTLVFDLTASAGYSNRIDLKIDAAETYTTAFKFEIDNMLFGDSTLSTSNFDIKNIASKIIISNPVKGAIEGNFERGNYSIISITGAAVASGVIDGNVNVEALTPGLYFLNVKEGVYKFVKE